MWPKTLKLPFLVLLSTLGLTAPDRSGWAQEAPAGRSPAIPKVWDAEAVASLQVPLADPAGSPIHVTADYYYRIPIRSIFKSYPVYAPDREPKGYLDWLKRQSPAQIDFDASRFKTDADWVEAGAIVFEAPIGTTMGGLSALEHVRDPRWYEQTKVPLATGGVLPFFRYVIRQEGKVEVGVVSCAMCHTRVMPDGRILKGAQGNFPLGHVVAYGYRKKNAPEALRAMQREFFGAPWVRPDPLAGLDDMPVEEIARIHESTPPGVMQRTGSSLIRR